MNAPLLIVLALILVGLPLILVVLCEGYKRHVTFKERQMELMAGTAAEKAAQYAAQVERLEQRMRVLERIATDKGARLATEIEDLRDEPATLPQHRLKDEELN
jgi:hypothetical protein